MKLLLHNIRFYRIRSRPRESLPVSLFISLFRSLSFSDRPAHCEAHLFTQGGKPLCSLAVPQLRHVTLSTPKFLRVFVISNVYCLNYVILFF